MKKLLVYQNTEFFFSWSGMAYWNTFNQKALYYLVCLKFMLPWARQLIDWRQIALAGYNWTPPPDNHLIAPMIPIVLLQSDWIQWQLLLTFCFSSNHLCMQSSCTHLVDPRHRHGFTCEMRKYKLLFMLEFMLPWVLDRGLVGIQTRKMEAIGCQTINWSRQWLLLSFNNLIG